MRFALGGLRTRQNGGIVHHEGLWLETHILAIDADHLEGLEALRQAGQITSFDGFHMIGMDPRGFTDLV